MPEEGAGKIGVPPHVRGMALNLQVKLAQVIGKEVGETSGARVAEQVLHRVELGRIGGETDNAQPVLLRGEELDHLAAPVRGQAVPHKDDPSRNVPPEGAQVIDKPAGVHAPRPDGEEQPALFPRMVWSVERAAMAESRFQLNLWRQEGVWPLGAQVRRTLGVVE